MTVRNLPLVGFLGLEANRGPVRYREWTKGDLSDDAVWERRQYAWDSIIGKLSLRLFETLPESVQELNRENLDALLTRAEVPPENKTFLMNYFTGELDFARESYLTNINNNIEKANRQFSPLFVIGACLPIANVISGIRKVIIGITNDGIGCGVIEEDRGWKFRATIIAVGIAEICFLGLIVHGIATLYFAMTSLEAQAAQA